MLASHHSPSGILIFALQPAASIFCDKNAHHMWPWVVHAFPSASTCSGALKCAPSNVPWWKWSLLLLFSSKAHCHCLLAFSFCMSFCKNGEAEIWGHIFGKNSVNGHNNQSTPMIQWQLRRLSSSMFLSPEETFLVSNRGAFRCTSLLLNSPQLCGDA